MQLAPEVKLLTVLVPIVGGLLLFVLVLVSFEAARGVAVDEQEQKIEELVDLAGSSIERLWIAPRNHTVRTLSRSTTLHRRIEGEAPFKELAREWKAAAEVLKGYFFIYYGLRDGTIEYYPDGELPEGYDPRERPWYEAGMRSEGGARWTAPGFSQTNPIRRLLVRKKRMSNRTGCRRAARSCSWSRALRCPMDGGSA